MSEENQKSDIEIIDDLDNTEKTPIDSFLEYSLEIPEKVKKIQKEEPNDSDHLITELTKQVIQLTEKLDNMSNMNINNNVDNEIKTLQSHIMEAYKNQDIIKVSELQYKISALMAQKEVKNMQVNPLEKAMRTMYPWYGKDDEKTTLAANIASKLSTDPNMLNKDVVSLAKEIGNRVRQDRDIRVNSKTPVLSPSSIGLFKENSKAIKQSEINSARNTFPTLAKLTDAKIAEILLQSKQYGE